MEAKSLGIFEVLTKGNYDRWNILMKNYLMGRNLWTVVEKQGTGYPSWPNRKALYTIQQACESKIFDEIKDFTSAKDAWNFLASRYGSDLTGKPDIEQGAVDDNLYDYREVYKHVEKGDWEAAKSLVKLEREPLFLPSDSDGRTILHFATLTGHVNVVMGLLQEGGKRLITMQDKRGNTALALAADLTGDKDVAKCLVQFSPNLLTTMNNDGEIPLLLAARKGHKLMTRYLFYETPMNYFKDQDYHTLTELLKLCIKGDIFDVALRLLDYNYLDLDLHSPEFLKEVFDVLNALAKKPSAFLNCCRFGLLQQIGIMETCEQKRTYCDVKQILKYMTRIVEKLNNSHLQNTLVYTAMLDAAKHGIVEFIEAMADAKNDLLWAIDGHNRDIFSYAILHRKEKVFQLIYDLNGRKEVIKNRKDLFGNNLLHLAGHLGSSFDLNLRSGAALQMQREIQWFQAVEEIVPPKCYEERNDNNMKPHELFTEEHKELVKEGERWAKQAAKSFALVGILITTVMFAAAFTVPGGNNQKGVPIFLNDPVFTTFVVADTISLFTSATSVLIFIWILTSRFHEKDFLKRLPSKLLGALIFLCFSVVSMMIAFCAAIGIVVKNFWANKPLVVGGIALGIIPVITLVPSQAILIWEIFRSTLLANPIRATNRNNTCMGQIRTFVSKLHCE
ncbi:hypothetical protein Fmac_002892 [Flemingia macrophylla]|uniref:PGG domain-containing protein n=1 Tax=Flemingia macrophylla TaxID=520843 RepID=A0ABD1NLA4_9FABA